MYVKKEKKENNPHTIKKPHIYMYKRKEKKRKK